MAKLIQGAYPVFTDVDGNPLEDGFIFIGEPALDPIANPIQAYWDEDLTVPANNIRTKGGYPLNGTAPGRLFVAGTYSILVQNKRAITVYSETTFFESGAEYSYPGFISQTFIADGIIGRRASDDIVSFIAPWGKTPKQATSLVLTLPTGGLSVVDGATGTVNAVSSFTISSLALSRTKVKFALNETGIGIGMTPNTPVYLLINGNNFKLELQ